MPYMVTFTINIPQMLAYIPYMDPMGMFFTDKKSSDLELLGFNKSGSSDRRVFHQKLAAIRRNWL